MIEDVTGALTQEMARQEFERRLAAVRTIKRLANNLKSVRMQLDYGKIRASLVVGNTAPLSILLDESRTAAEGILEAIKLLEAT